uniref:Sushi domain-containing protein n=1 Tax=Cyprinodon variegatus TaxID=28743 RepID=A0A3Q2DJ30_CYPVA
FVVYFFNYFIVVFLFSLFLYYPRPFRNGLVIGQDYSVGMTISFECLQGYTLIGEASLTCLHGVSRNWNHPIPKSVTCGHPGSPIYGRTTGDGFNYNDVVRFSCNKGYTLEGPSTAQCQANRQWIVPPFLHAEVDCGHPGTPPHAVMIGEKFTFGSAVHYSCREDRQLIGDSSLTCQVNGHWSGPLPHCSGKLTYKNEISGSSSHRQQKCVKNKKMYSLCRNIWFLYQTLTIFCN